MRFKNCHSTAHLCVRSGSLVHETATYRGVSVGAALLVNHVERTGNSKLRATQSLPELRTAPRSFGRVSIS